MEIDSHRLLAGTIAESVNSGEQEQLVQEAVRFTEETPDRVLLEAIRSHDTSAYSELYRRYVDTARAAAYRIAPDLSVEDLVAESFARIIQATHRGKGPTEAFKPYMYRVIRSVAAELIRKPTPVVYADMEDLPDNETPLDCETQHFEHAALARAFAKLPESWQRVLWHAEVEGLPPREVAVILDSNPRAISQMVIRAKRACVRPGCMSILS